MTRRIAGAAAVLLTAALLFLAACGRPRTEDLTIPGARGEIPATLTMPDSFSGAAVVFCHGFTGNRQLDGHAEPLARALADHGIASLAIDFAGSGQSTEPFTAYTPASMQQDLDAAISYLVDSCGADPDRIGLLGHSMGGRAVTLALDDTVRAAALWAPADNTGLDGLEFLDHTAEGRQALWDAAVRDGSVNLPAWGVTVSREFFEQMAVTDPAACLRGYSGALLLAFTAGDAELLSTDTIDLTRTAAAQSEARLTDLTGEFEDATHNFTALSGDADQDAEVRSRIEDATADFFAEAL